MSRYVLLEFNELCPSLIYKWTRDGALPNFKRLYDQSAVCETRADVSDPLFLEPWIQWYSVHTGLAYNQHKVFHLTDGARAGHEDIWKTLQKAGLHTGSFASMNNAPFKGNGNFYVADPWSNDGFYYPESLKSYSDFVSTSVREYSNSRKLSLADYLKFMAFMVTNGLQSKTSSLIARQLMSEVFSDKRLSYKRVAILDRLQFDVFQNIYRKTKPDFATFFLNSTAHLQHAYWRHMEPEAFQVQPSDQDIEFYRDAIFFGYKAMDQLIGEFLELAKAEGARLIFMTALSQQPFLRHEQTGGQNFYRLHDVQKFLRGAGIHFEKVEPTMTNQYMISFYDNAERAQARDILNAYEHEGGQKLFDFPKIDSSGLYFGCGIFKQVDPQSYVRNTKTGETVSCSKIFYKIDALKSGRHHPAGALWFQIGTHKDFKDQVSILDVFPTILDLFGVSVFVPDSRQGRSLAAELRN